MLLTPDQQKRLVGRLTGLWGKEWTYGSEASEALQQVAPAEDQHPGTPLVKGPADHKG